MYKLRSCGSLRSLNEEILLHHVSDALQADRKGGGWMDS